MTPKILPSSSPADASVGGRPQAVNRAKSGARRVADILVLSLLTSLAASASATVLVNDTWKDSSRTDPASPTYSENGTDADADGNLESAWFRGGAGTISIVTNPPSTDQLLLGTVEDASSSSWTTYFTPEANPVTLVGPGDQFKITWVFTPSVINASNTSQGLRIGIVDSPAARLTADGTPGTAAYAGYDVALNFGTMFNRNGALQLEERAAPATASAFLSASSSWTSLGNVGTRGQEGFLSGSNYTFTFTATLVSGGALEVIASVSGANIGGTGFLSFTNTDATPNSLAFDTFGLRPSSGAVSATNFATRLFKVEYIPSCTPGNTYAVTGGGAYCPSDAGANVGLAGSQTGIGYQLKLGVADVGTPVAGTGSGLNFGPQTAGTYTVVASNGTCFWNMTGSAVVTQNASPAITSQPSPSSAVNSTGDGRVFSVGATGTGLTYQWQHAGTNLLNGNGYSGVTTSNLTITLITATHTGVYDVVVSGTCSPPVTSDQVTLSIVDSPGLFYRSIASGNWSDNTIWEQSANGVSYVGAVAAPDNHASNILVQAGHIITVASDVTVDQVTVQAGAKVSVTDGVLTINNSFAAVDFDVAGTLEVLAGIGGLNANPSSLRFSSGGQFNWNRLAAPIVPPATWLDGSLCRISATATNTDVFAAGISGQSYYDFVFDTTAGGQSRRCRFDINGTNTIMRRDLIINIPDTTNASVTLNNDTNAVLTVGRDVTFSTGSTVTSTKVALNNVAGASYIFRVGRNFTASGVLDGFGSSSTFIEFNGTGTQTLTLPLGGNLINRGSMNWTVKSGSTVALGSQIDGFNSFTNQGTLTFNANTIAGGTTLAFNAGGVVNAHGTNYIATNLNTFVAGGTVNLGTLPPLAVGNTFQFIDAITYAGTFGTLLPATPDGTHVWDVSQLNTAATLTVANSAGGPATNPTNIVSSFSGGNVTLSWPTDHIGWTLQTQTNSRAVGLTPATNTWFNVSGSTTTNSVAFPVSTANPTVFFRLKL